MKNKQNILFIINPISGIGKKNIIPKSIDQHLDLNQFNFDITYSEYKKHGHQIALENKLKYDAIIAIGGDGTVNEIGTALIHSDCALGIIPVGSGNGIARHLKIPLSLNKAISDINIFNIKTIDTGLCNKTPFIGTCGFGFDAFIAKEFDNYHKRGFMSYIKLVIKSYRKFEPIKFKVISKKQTKIKDAMICCVANSSEFGNGLSISPQSNINDGQFEVVFIEKVNLRNMPKLIRQFFTNKVSRSKYFESIELDNDFTIEIIDGIEEFSHIDGETIPGKKNYEIKILPNSLKIIC